jgi:XXXCH domain-containing protein
MGSKEIKMEKQLSGADSEVFFKNLADALAGKPEVDLSALGFDLQNFKKIKMDLKKDGEQLGLKLKIKFSSPETESGIEDTSAPLKYKTLKKQMKNTFKNLKASIESGSLPEPEVVETFMQQAELMVSFTDKGYGDEYYEEFIQLCHDLKQAFEAGELEPLVTAYNCIDARKALCHDKYD